MQANSVFSHQKIDVLALSPSEEILTRIGQVTDRLKLALHCLPDVKEFISATDYLGSPAVIILDLSSTEENLVAIERVRLVKKFATGVLLVALVRDPSDVKFIDQLIEVGVDQVQVAADVLSSMRLDFLLMHQFLLKYFPIELRDLFPSTEITFTAYHYMALNNKYLPVVFENFLLTDKKFKRLEKIQQLYIQAPSTEAYQNYIESYYDSFSMGLQKRTKAAFLRVISAYSQIRLLMMDAQRPGGSEKMQSLLKSCQESHHRLLDYTKSSANPFFIYIQLYQNHGVCHWDRNLFIAGLAAFLADMSGLAQPENILKCSLVAYSGLMYSDHLTYLKWHDHPENHWSTKDTEQFCASIPVSSELAQSQFSDFEGTMSKAVAHIFERFDGKGQPHQVSGEGIPVETSLIQLAEGWLRQISKTKLGDATQAYESFKLYLVKEKTLGKINPQVIEKIQQVGFLKSEA